ASRGREAALLYVCMSKLTVDRCNCLCCSLTKNALPIGFIRARSLSHALIALSSSLRKGCVVANPPFNRATCNTRLSVSTWSSFHAAGLGHAQAMPKHEKQQAPVADLVPSALGCLNQPFNLARGEMLPVADLCQPPASVPRRGPPPPARFCHFWRVDHFVES